MAPTKLLSREDLMLAIHRAVVEVFTLREAGRPLTDATNARDDRIIPRTNEVNVTFSDDQSPVLSYPDEQVKETILQSTIVGEPVEEVIEVQNEMEADTEPSNDTAATTPLEEVSATPVEQVMHPENQELPTPPTQPALPQDPTWLNISLRDPAIKFAVRLFPHPTPFTTRTLTLSTDNQTRSSTYRSCYTRPHNPTPHNHQIPPLPPQHTAQTEETRSSPRGG